MATPKPRALIVQSINVIADCKKIFQSTDGTNIVHILPRCPDLVNYSVPGKYVNPATSMWGTGSKIAKINIDIANQDTQ